MVVGISCMPSEGAFATCSTATRPEAATICFFKTSASATSCPSEASRRPTSSRASCNPREATDEDRIAFRQVTRHRQESFNPDIPDIQEIPMLMDAFHSDPFWEELGSRCLSCTACSAVCPTCYCFDIRDTLDPDGKTGKRERVWDACTSPQFAEVAGGHNFRADGRGRVRHRMYHKLNGFPLHAQSQSLRRLREMRVRMQGEHLADRGAQVLRTKGGLKHHAHSHVRQHRPFFTRRGRKLGRRDDAGESVSSLARPHHLHHRAHRHREALRVPARR